METAQIVILLMFGIVSLIHLIGEFLHNKNIIKVEIIRYITKPLLMPLLMLFYTIKNPSINWWIVIALIGGFFGDVSLMLPDPKKTKKWLKIGLISFLLGHIFYIVAFVIEAEGFAEYKLWSIFVAFPFVIAGSIIHPILTKHTGEMTLAVSIYVLVITAMGISTTFLFGVGDLNSVLMVFFGAWFFAVSDTINAYVKFVKQFKYERTIIMLTYITGQFLIILGIMIINSAIAFPI